MTKNGHSPGTPPKIQLPEPAAAVTITLCCTNIAVDDLLDEQRHGRGRVEFAIAPVFIFDNIGPMLYNMKTWSGLMSIGTRK